MGLRINTSIPALNAGRAVERSTRALTRSLERLSSGLRINRAADDAAGLAVAEGLRTQVRGAQSAQRNAQDEINLVQTAEGALGETNILQRTRELALQSANDTRTSANRVALNTEVQQLIAQVASIALDTRFNGVNVRSSNQTITSDLGVSPVDISAAGGAVSAIRLVDVALASVNTLGAAWAPFKTGWSSPSTPWPSRRKMRPPRRALSGMRISPGRPSPSPATRSWSTRALAIWPRPTRRPRMR